MGTPPVTWEGALRSFLLHKKATRAEKTVRFYRIQLTQLVHWANANRITLEGFGKRLLDEYLSFRLDRGLSRTTTGHDALCAMVFTEWCAKNDYLNRDPLYEYKRLKTPTPHKYMPTEEDVTALVSGIYRFWDPAINTTITEVSPAKRDFHRDRNYALILTLIDSACRVGEVLNLHIEDFTQTVDQTGTIWQLSIREAKGGTPRAVPLSEVTAEAIAEWMKVRKSVMKDVPKAEDEGWLFMSETGIRIMDRVWRRTFQHFVTFAGLSTKFTLHGLRRFSLNKLAKHNLLMAQIIAGHKDPKTTLIYTRIDPSFVRAQHQEVGVVRGIVQKKQPVKKQRLVR